jgi:hypothetical protein
MASRTHVKDSSSKKATLAQRSIKNTLSFYAYSLGERSFGYALSDQEWPFLKMNPMWITLVPQDQHHNTLPSMMHHPWNTTPFSPYDYFLGPSMTSPFWTSPTLVNPFNLLKSLLPPFTLHHRRSLPLKTYKRPLFLSICGIIYLLSPWIWKKPCLLSRHTWFPFINAVMRWSPRSIKPTKHVLYHPLLF